MLPGENLFVKGPESSVTVIEPKLGHFWHVLGSTSPNFYPIFTDFSQNMYGDGTERAVWSIFSLTSVVSQMSHHGVQINVKNLEFAADVNVSKIKQ